MIQSNDLITNSQIILDEGFIDMDVRYISAVLFVKDMELSRRFYEGLFGQQVDTDFGKNVGYTSGLALWEVGVAHKIIYDCEYADSTPLGRQNFEIYFESDDIEAVWHELQAEGVNVIQPLYEQPWGQRTLRISDPDGHIVDVGEPMPLAIKRLAADGLDSAAIHAKTMMPVSVIENILQDGKNKN
jgi:predicted enzyme related to lactoylglutathione lyase